MNGWSKDSLPESIYTCALCRDPDGAHLLSSLHTYEEGCLEHEKIVQQLKEAGW